MRAACSDGGVGAGVRGCAYGWVEVVVCSFGWGQGYVFGVVGFEEGRGRGCGGGAGGMFRRCGDGVLSGVILRCLLFE